MCKNRKVIVVNLLPDRLQNKRHNFPFTWANHKLKYLGIYFTPSISNIFKKNFHSWLTKTKGEIKRWHQLSFTWFRRNCMLKMTVLPRLLYLLQTLPVLLPCTFLFSYRLLSLPKMYGGIGFPDPTKYYYAVHQTRTLYWIKQREKGWVGLEKDLSLVPLKTLPWQNALFPQASSLIP